MLSVSKQRIVAISTENESMKSTNHLSLRTKEAEIAELKKELQESERQKEQIKFQLMMNNSRDTQDKMIDDRSDRTADAKFESLLDELKIQSEKIASDFAQTETINKNQLLQLRQLGSSSK